MLHILYQSILALQVFSLVKRLLGTTVSPFSFVSAYNNSCYFISLDLFILRLMQYVLSGIDRTFLDILQGLNCFSNFCKSLARDYRRTKCTSFSKMSIQTIQCSWQPEGHICFNGFLHPSYLLFPKGIRKDLISGHSLIDCDGHLLSEGGLGVCRCDDNCSVTMAATFLAPHLFS